jgi:diguanylate cyclase
LSQFTTPALIARETLRRLATQRRAPTPENYRELYREIADGKELGPLAPDSQTVVREMLAAVLEAPFTAPLSEGDDLLQEAKLLAGRVRNAADTEELQKLAVTLKEFCLRLETRALHSRELHGGLSRLLRLLLNNIGELIVDDSWVLGQLETVRGIVAHPPSPAMIDEAERYLREVLLKQGTIKAGLREAKTALRSALENFIGHIGTFSEDAGAYGQTVTSYAERIRAADDIGTLNQVIAGLLRDTEAVRDRTAARQREWQETQQRARTAEARIAELEEELLRTGEKLRHDHLTGALNRRGFDEAFARETARALRERTPLCMALIDIDNFKQLNDRYGHRAGDDALLHVVRVVNGALRPGDFVARHGGEEFLVLLPDSSLRNAEQTILRLQRELTRRFFLQGNDRLLITFSAGVAQWQPEESQDELLSRADAAQYSAKTAGKNRVVLASASASPPARAQGAN